MIDSLIRFDPMYVDDAVEKFHHVMKDGQRVRVIESGHVGVLQGVNHGGGHTVKLDSGHTIVCREHELEPEDFPTHGGEAKRQLTAAHLVTLQKALASDRISLHDRVAIQLHLDGVQKHRGLELQIFADGHTHDQYMLRMFAEKYADVSAGDAGGLAKAGAGRATFPQVGDRFKDRWGECGKITAVDEGRADVQYDSGIYGTVLLGHLKAA